MTWQAEFEQKQVDMREQVVKFEKFIQENDAKRIRAEAKAKQVGKVTQLTPSICPCSSPHSRYAGGSSKQEAAVYFRFFTKRHRILMWGTISLAPIILGVAQELHVAFISLAVPQGPLLDLTSYKIGSYCCRLSRIGKRRCHFKT